MKTEYIQIAPPAGLVRECRPDPFAGRTNGDYLEWVVGSLSLMMGCNRDNSRGYKEYLESLESGE